jgi:hypothetical protein
MAIRKFLLFSFVTVLFFSCAGVPFYTSDHPLATEVVKSADGSVQSRIPLGWFASNDPSLAPQYLFWLIKDDYSGTITLQEVKVDRATGQRINKEGLNLLAEISMAFKKESTDKFLQTKPIELFTINTNSYSGFEYYSDGTSRRIRVVVFKMGNRYFEATAMPLSGVWYEKDLRALLNALHSFLNSLHSSYTS